MSQRNKTFGGSWSIIHYAEINGYIELWTGMGAVFYKRIYRQRKPGKTFASFFLSRVKPQVVLAAIWADNERLERKFRYPASFVETYNALAYDLIHDADLTSRLVLSRKRKRYNLNTAKFFFTRFGMDLREYE